MPVCTFSILKNVKSFEANLFVKNDKTFLRILGKNGKSLSTDARVELQVHTSLEVGDEHQLFIFQLVRLTGKNHTVEVRLNGLTHTINAPLPRPPFAGFVLDESGESWYDRDYDEYYRVSPYDYPHLVQKDEDSDDE